MPRFTNGFGKIPREVLDISRRDPLLRALIATLCIWAKTLEDSDDGIAKGQVITSDGELAGELGCDRTTIIRKIKILTAEKVIKCERNYHLGRPRGRLITIVALSNMQQQTCTKSAQKMQQLAPMQDKAFEQNANKVCTEVATRNESRELREERERENARARAGKEKKSLSFSSNQIEKDNLIILPLGIEPKKALPVEEESLARDWYRRGKEKAPIRAKSFDQILAEIYTVRDKGYSLEKQRQIFEFLEKASPKIGERYLLPMDGLKDYFDQPVIEAAYNKFLNSIGGKEIQAKTSIKTKAALEQKESLAQKLVREAQEKALQLKNKENL